MTNATTVDVSSVPQNPPEKSKRRRGSGGIEVLAEQTERWPIRKLFANKRNSKRHSPDQIAQIAASIKHWGWTMPILVSESGEIQAGEGRWLAAKSLDIEDVPVIVARGWSRNKRRAYVIADNKIAENGSWDKDMLSVEIGDLRQTGFDLSLIGFTKTQIENLLPKEDEAEQGTGAQYQIVITCETEQHQKDLLTRFEKEGVKCRALMA